MAKHHLTIPDEDRLKELLAVSSIRAEEVGMNSSKYEDLFDSTFKQQGARPHRRGIVRIRLSDTDAFQDVYRKYKQVTFVDDTEIIVSFSTVQEIRGVNAHSINGYDVDVESAGRIMGRLKFYWHHPDDTARASFKLAIIGLLLAVAAFMI